MASEGSRQGCSSQTDSTCFSKSETEGIALKISQWLGGQGPRVPAR
jgi:hypothetical protein